MDLRVLRSRLHHHPGHPQIQQLVGHQLQRAGHRGVRVDANLADGDSPTVVLGPLVT